MCMRSKTILMNEIRVELGFEPTILRAIFNFTPGPKG
jgi:hypothetical protein